MSKISEAKQQEFFEEIRGWNWARIVSNAKRCVEVDDDTGSSYGREFLGSVFGLTPSGKVYAPFACSNVTPCPHCDGKEELPNAMPDPLLNDLLIKEQHSIRMEAVKRYGSFVGGKWPDVLVSLLDSIESIIEMTAPTRQCPYCDGLGSEEAWWDELWQEALEAVAEEHGGFIVVSDSDFFFFVEFEPEGDNDDDDTGR